jgi:very-short-patch-repair endonuclease
MANDVARSLRKRMTSQEVKLWVHLRSWRKPGFRFRRQAPRDGYIVDFVFQSARKARRGARSEFYRARLRVLRFWNNEIDRNLEGVLTLIDAALQKPPPGLAARGIPPPSGEG